jgi:primosomal protein N''
VEDLVRENKLFQLYLRKLAENIECLKEGQDYEEFHCGFLRLHWVKQAERIERRVGEKEEGMGGEGEGRPSLDKYSN